MDNKYPLLHQFFGVIFHQDAFIAQDNPGCLLSIEVVARRIRSSLDTEIGQADHSGLESEIDRILSDFSEDEEFEKALDIDVSLSNLVNVRAILTEIKQVLGGESVLEQI